MKKIITLFGACALAFSMANADVNLYGPGGPHTALKDIASKYSEKTGVKVNVNFGPQATWFEKAKRCRYFIWRFRSIGFSYSK